ncbi:MAG TPA: HlyD family secretion protein [Pseudolabrys sp.]
MSDLKNRGEAAIAAGESSIVTRLPKSAPVRTKSRLRGVPVLLTFGAVAIAAALSWIMWNTYLGAPWTRDGTVRVYVVTMAPEVAGKIVDLPVVDNQFVHKGDLLMLVDPTDYAFAVQQAEAVVAQTKAVAQNAQAEAKRREELGVWSSAEEKQTFSSTAASAEAAYRQAQARLDQARVNLDRTRIVSPVNGYVTNLQAQLGDYVNVGQISISVVNADSFWVDGYFEESALWSIHEGDPARIKLMGSREIIQGHVQGFARGINVPNAESNRAGLATVNPIFTWVRLAQRVPVRIAIDHLPPGTRLVAGQTATVQIEPKR